MPLSNMLLTRLLRHSKLHEAHPRNVAKRYLVVIREIPHDASADYPEAISKNKNNVKNKTSLVASGSAFRSLEHIVIAWATKPFVSHMPRTFMQSRFLHIVLHGGRVLAQQMDLSASQAAIVGLRVLYFLLLWEERQSKNLLK